MSTDTHRHKCRSVSAANGKLLLAERFGNPSIRNLPEIPGKADL